MWLYFCVYKSIDEYPSIFMTFMWYNHDDDGDNDDDDDVKAHGNSLWYD